MIRVLLVDDHPALRAGLSAVLRSEPGIVPLGTAGSAEELWPALNRTHPDLVLLDYHLPPDDGLALCRRIRRLIPAPAVLMYSAYAGAQLVLPARLAGAAGLVHKSAPANELYDAIRTVAAGGTVLPPLPRELLQEAGERVEPEDLPILGMVLDDTPPTDIAQVLGLTLGALDARLDAMVGRLRVEVAAVSGD
jgi:DNA-binding NarL/FixJ family response regulator